MALKKSFSAKGVMASDGYWKVVERFFDDITGTGNVKLFGYFDKAARLENVTENVLAEKVYEITKEEYGQFFTDDTKDPRAQAYEFTKTKPEFDDANDA